MCSRLCLKVMITMLVLLNPDSEDLHMTLSCTVSSSAEPAIEGLTALQVISMPSSDLFGLYLIMLVVTDGKSC